MIEHDSGSLEFERVTEGKVMHSRFEVVNCGVKRLICNINPNMLQKKTTKKYYYLQLHYKSAITMINYTHMQMTQN